VEGEGGRRVTIISEDGSRLSYRDIEDDAWAELSREV